jgi:hypothetical protein
MSAPRIDNAPVTLPVGAEDGELVGLGLGVAVEVGADVGVELVGLGLGDGVEAEVFDLRTVVVVAPAALNLTVCVAEAADGEPTSVTVTDTMGSSIAASRNKRALIVRSSPRPTTLPAQRMPSFPLDRREGTKTVGPRPRQTRAR